MIDSAHEACKPDETALVWDVAKSREKALGNVGSSKESVLLETDAVCVTAPAEQMAPEISHDEAPIHGTSAAHGDELDAEQSLPLQAGCSVSRELQERND